MYWEESECAWSFKPSLTQSYLSSSSPFRMTRRLVDASTDKTFNYWQQKDTSFGRLKDINKIKVKILPFILLTFYHKTFLKSFILSQQTMCWWANTIQLWLMEMLGWNTNWFRHYKLKRAGGCFGLISDFSIKQLTPRSVFLCMSSGARLRLFILLST